MYSIFYVVFQARPLYDFYVAELPQVHRTSILGMNPDCLYAGPGDWTRVATVLGEAANHYTNDAGCSNSSFKKYVVMWPVSFHSLMKLKFLNQQVFHEY